MNRSNSMVTEDESDSETGSIRQDPNGSLLSLTPDRYGFLGGSQYTSETEPSLPVEILRRRERKWIYMFQHWDSFFRSKPEKIRERCLKGIPPSVRGRAWFFLCGARVLRGRNPGLFEHLSRQPCDANIRDEIERDLHRQFPHHEMFADSGGRGQRELFRVLKSYALLFPRDGYCQGQAPLAATLLMHMPAEHAFWCLVAMCERYLTRYFAPGLHQLQVDSEILMALLKKTDYAIYKHLKSQQITPLLFMTDWFMCVYSRTLPWESVLRIWDSFFFDGPKVLFVVAITLMRISVGSAKIRKECPSLYETISRIRNIDPEELIPQHLLPRLRKLHLESTELRRVNQKILLKRKKEAAANAAASTKNTPTAPRNGLTQTPPSAQASSLSTSSSSVHQSPNNNLGGYGALPHHPTAQQIQQQPPLKVHGLGQLLETPL